MKKLSAFFFLFVLHIATDAFGNMNAPQGYVDSIQVTSKTIILTGWAGASPGDRVSSVEVYLGDKLLFCEKVSTFERSDVAQVTGRRDWLNSGWRVEAKIPQFSKSGKNPVKVKAVFESGKEVFLEASSKRASILDLGKEHKLGGIENYFFFSLIVFLLSLAASGVVFANQIADLSRKYTKAIKPLHIAIFAILSAFIGLVGLGITGSSIEIGLCHSSGLINADGQRVAGQSRPIRSDEWLVITPMAIAQFNHEPKFPLINKNLGPEGQNMLIVGMTGVPVAHITALAKPATWGFFFFDLRRALAWYWWLPIFGCLFSIWGTTGILLSGCWRLSLSVSVIFISSAYIVAWSYWPAYTVMFPASAFCFFYAILNTKSWGKALVLGVLLGISTAGFVLVLYPPWQVSLGYLYLFLVCGISVRDRIWNQLNVVRASAISIAVIVTGIIIWSWLSDSKNAIDLIRATVYPGNRNSLTGGTLTYWEFFKGFLNHHTLYYESASITNQSESASFLYFFPPVILFMTLDLFRRKYISPVEVVLISFCLILVWFQFLGFFPLLSKLSLFNHVAERRTDLALGLSSFLLCGLYLFGNRSVPLRNSSKIEGIIIGTTYSVLIALAARQTPDKAIGDIKAAYYAMIFLSVFLLTYSLIVRKIRLFIVLSLLITITISAAFNPLSIAPKKISLSSKINSNTKDKEHILVVGSHINAMMLMAAGQPVTNGVFYYPQHSFWKAMDFKDRNKEIINRYQHLIFIPKEIEGAIKYKIESPNRDVVRIVFDPIDFDFRLTGATKVLSPLTYHHDLSKNKHLKLIRTGPGLNLYKVM